MQNCLFCNSDTNLDSHHVCWWYYRSKKGIKYRVRSWKASLVVPLCRTCHDNYHKSTNYDDFISKYKSVKDRNNIIRLFPIAKQIIEEAIRLSYIIPLIDQSLCGNSYFYVKTKVPNFDDAVKIASSGNVDNHMWGVATKRISTGYEPHYTINDSMKNYDYLSEQIYKIVGRRFKYARRTGKDAILNLIQNDRSKKKYPTKFRKDEFDYALCRMVAKKQITFDAKYKYKTVGQYVNGRKKKKEVLVYYYKLAQISI